MTSPSGAAAGAGVLTTPRLVLRQWRESDLAPFATLNADPEVMAHFVSPLAAEQSDAFARERITPHFSQYGYGLWAVERRDTEAFIGFVGLCWQDFAASFTPALEIGWRLARSQWGHGFATEAAVAALDFGFTQTDVDEIVSMTSTGNLGSRAVMERLHMRHDPADDFDHPRVPDGHRLQRHVLYRITRTEWLSRRSETGPSETGRSETGQRETGQS